jgi:hypothetical protein
MNSMAWRRVAALAVLLVVSVPVVVIVASSSGGEDATSSALRAERVPPGLVLYMEDPSVNQPATLDGDRAATIECLDSGGSAIWRGARPWPFTDTDGGRLDPHVHIDVEPARLARIVRCRLAGSDPSLEAKLP